MIVWCAYCQRFVQERPPFEELDVSHGLCPDCAELEDDLGEDLTSALAIRGFLRSNARAILEGRIPEPRAMLDEARALGIQRTDLLLGLFQPLFCEVGRRFESREIDVSTEHRISEFFQAIVDRLDDRRAERGSSDFLLAAVPGNRHSLGLSVVAEILAEKGHRTEILPRADADEILARLAAGDYRWLGLSVALPGDLEMAREVARTVRRASPGLGIAGGGWAFKTPGIDRHLPEFDRILDADDVTGLRFGGAPSPFPRAASP